MKCQFCSLEYHDSEYHPGTCVNCGGPKPIEAAQNDNYFLEIDMYRDCVVYDERGRYVRMATEEDKKTLDWWVGEEEIADKKVYCINDNKPLCVFTFRPTLTEEDMKRIRETARGILMEEVGGML